MLDAPPEAAPGPDVLVVGAGFAGVYAVHRFREAGLSVRCVEVADDVGGVWWWNRYPGARCDVESLDYSYSFSPEIQAEWRWTERYATQPEILAYLRFVADRLGVREHTTFGVRVVAARYDAADPGWTVTLDDGSEVRTRRLVWATGPLTVPLRPDVEGLDRFAGRVLHSGRWPHEEVDFSGRRVACLGTGSSGIQMVPRLAEAAEHLHVLQRTPNFSIPAHNFVYDEHRLAEAMAGYDERRRVSWSSAGGTPSTARDLRTFDVDAEERRKVFEEAWAVGGGRFTRAFADLVTDERANAEAVAFVHEKIREVVRDPDVAEKLLPRDHALGARRICVDTGYYETFNRANVTLVDLRAEPLRRVTERGVVVGDREIEVDDLVLATGFDGLTGALSAIDVVGRGRPPPPPGLGRRSRQLPGTGRARLPRHVRAQRAGQPVGARQHGADLRAAGRLGDRAAGPRGRPRRGGDGRGAGRLGGAGRPDVGAAARQAHRLLVHRGQRARQAARLRDLRRRLPHLPAALRRRRRP
ncbi:NAD(P)/FAD-dependent oxidoreductase [Nocardioides sp. TF02-7]|uniref:flavin-containing monooxygenase n=1 Tax=Nocardioides sp. TF02-7 TaxID=2917724 RepID=UPI001F070F14|nr:NAD(P)/FAD-dependent oxidoreductase [Nocardioides sp. TF02-7]UMG91288.1 NAD(P)/FAD-dependent oxidoreductase [Nocardioides sp. TF02-7]